MFLSPGWAIRICGLPVTNWGGELGPIGQAVREREFEAVHLLTDHAARQSRAYRAWLNDRCGIKAALHPVSLTGPTRFDEIYEAAVSVLDSLRGKANDLARFVYHLSPGTPAMAAVWIVLAKTTHPAGTHRVVRAGRRADGLLSI